jgi:hypothetical protein
MSLVTASAATIGTAASTGDECPPFLSPLRPPAFVDRDGNREHAGGERTPEPHDAQKEPDQNSGVAFEAAIRGWISNSAATK